MSTKRPHPDASGPADYTTSPKITDRSSVFLGLYSPLLPAQTLQADPSIADASHKIAAWRIASTQRTLDGGASGRNTTYETGHDDDGERGAGVRLAKYLADANIAGSVVVARWYGGVLLGPVRFAHIERCAREAVELWDERAGAQRKRARAEAVRTAEAVARDRERLLGELPQRDESIEVLRTLLAQKKGETGVDRSPGKKIAYDSMTVEVLKRMEKARDATIAYLLKQIDQAEAGGPQEETESKTDTKTDKTESTQSGLASSNSKPEPKDSSVSVDTG